MRKGWVLAAAGVLLAALACDSKLPVDAGVQTVAIEVQANASALEVDIWDVFADTNGDGSFETELPFKDCRDTGDIRSTVVPWRYSAEIAIIRPGATTEEIVATSIGTSNEFSSVSPYDTRIIASPGEFVDPDDGFFRTNGRRVTHASRDYLVNCAGLGGIIEDSNLLGADPTFEIPVEQGATVIFRARMQLLADAIPYDSAIASAPELSAAFAVDGAEVEAQGEGSARLEDGTGLALSVRVR